MGPDLLGLPFLRAISGQKGPILKDVRMGLHVSRTRLEHQGVRGHCGALVGGTSFSDCGLRPLSQLALASSAVLGIARHGRHGVRRFASTAPTVGRPTLIVDPLSFGLIERLRNSGCLVEERGPQESVVDALKRVRPEIVIVRSSMLKEAQLEAAGTEGLALVMRAGAGVDNIAVDVLVQKNVVVANAAGANAVAVAELTMAHLLNLDRQLSDQVASLRRGEWRRLEFVKASGLYGRTLAVLGVGYIGREVVKRAHAFGMEVRVWSRSLTRDEAKSMGAIWCDSPISAADGAHALTVHLPLNGDTKGVVGKELLQHLRPGALVVNMSRGGVVDEAALLQAIDERGLRAGLDVFAREPAAGDRVFEDDALRSCEHVYGTHHTGARTAQAGEAVEDAVVRVVDAYFSGASIPGALS